MNVTYISAIAIALVVAGCAVSSPSKRLEQQPPVDKTHLSAPESLTAFNQATSSRHVLDNTELLSIPVPMHLAVPNLAITQSLVESRVTDLFQGSSNVSVTTISTTMQWAVDNMNYVSPTYLPQSQLWGVVVTGTLLIRNPISHFGTIPTGSKAWVAADVEHGALISLRLKP